MSPDDGTLWILATPIGTIGDFPPRARDVLDGADLILAEDTRRARSLLRHVGAAPGGRLWSLHEHNEERRVERVLEELAAGRSAARAAVTW